MNRRNKRKSSAAAAAGNPASKRAATQEDYDSDQEPPVETVKDRMSSWRLDPEESLSDYTIEIVVNNKKYATYHVHKHFLAVGPRKAEYFVKLFSGGGRFAENKDATSRIELEELAAKHFPTLLDYFYEGDLPLTTNNATALHSMAKYFDMRRLRWEAKQFWQKDISDAKTFGIYYEHARILADEKVLDAATKSCSENIMTINKSSRLMKVPEPTLWLNILQNQPKEDIAAEQFSRHASTLIAEFANQNLDLEVAMFQQLTAPKLLPHIHVEAALRLIDAERQIVAPGEGRLSNLQERCVAALSKDWNSINLQARSNAMTLAKKQSPVVLTEILSGTLSVAKKDMGAKMACFHRADFSSQQHGGYSNSPAISSSCLPEGHTSTHGTNVRINRGGGWPVNYDTYPLFYYKKP